ncbi:Hypothetical protein NTJ_12009 [Nesidiocoris tenuis]|uniref:Uncharacterized protein n=1 Tax=Nesidiocoris tenuis TaxID=355587 RepID=A0ABN7B457_9HEMI|nr:Hypothetical protein NTJ_12009 [Nesidiocoris tenuis]
MQGILEPASPGPVILGNFSLLVQDLKSREPPGNPRVLPILGSWTCQFKKLQACLSGKLQDLSFEETPEPANPGTLSAVLELPEPGNPENLVLANAGTS